ncbi:hypothetical protein N4G63_022685 (plasmid) [Aquabacterium sp. OR-4]|nr:hypothetical protein [Aquabacterium sp. OR-4]MDT7838001.1 hypothetical protein [Aquabacterium sp. OR-4]
MSQRVRWDIDEDVLRGRQFDLAHKFLPDALSQVQRLDGLSADEQRLLSQIQGRTYANMFGLVERFIGAKMLELSRSHWFADQVALQALVRFADEELKHQALFRRVDEMMAQAMPPGYHFTARPDEVAMAVMQAPDWSVLALTCHIELFTQVHYRQSIGTQPGLSPIFRDIFLYHWREESQHAILDELEWRRVHRTLDTIGRDQGVDGLIVLVAAVDGIVQTQAQADAACFEQWIARRLPERERQRLRTVLLQAYRWQYIGSGVRDARFAALLEALTTPVQRQRLQRALAPLMD